LQTDVIEGVEWILLLTWSVILPFKHNQQLQGYTLKFKRVRKIHLRITFKDYNSAGRS